MTATWIIIYRDKNWTQTFILKLFGRPRLSWDILPKSLAFQGFKRHAKLFDPHPFTCKKNHPTENIRTQKLGLCSSFVPELRRSNASSRVLLSVLVFKCVPLRRWWKQGGLEWQVRVSCWLFAWAWSWITSRNQSGTKVVLQKWPPSWNFQRSSAFLWSSEFPMSEASQQVFVNQHPNTTRPQIITIKTIFWNNPVR